MSIFAVIRNGVVINTILAESKSVAEEVTNQLCIEIEQVPTGPGIGWTYNGTSFTAPVIEEPVEETPAE